MNTDSNNPVVPILVQEALFITDSNSVILHVNEAFTKINGNRPLKPYFLTE
ncbi:MAG: hypothetical protein HOO92_06525 [Methylococcaceae bacterium]|nr:hypothetical protein [Methylococcaceae bacterium]